MHTILRHVLDESDLAAVAAIVQDGQFVDGRLTSEVAAKSNLQLAIDSGSAARAGALVLQRLRECHELERFAQPVVVHPLLFSRYDPGMTYPDHVDVAVMGAMRTDLALTLFLSDLEDYDGGELVVDTRAGVRRFRLPAGDAIVYPANTVHRVEPVTRGSRLAAVTWIQSLVGDPAKRRILASLDAALEDLADSPSGPRLRRAQQNLLRLWAEPVTGSTASSALADRFDE